MVLKADRAEDHPTDGAKLGIRTDSGEVREVMERLSKENCLRFSENILIEKGVERNLQCVGAGFVNTKTVTGNECRLFLYKNTGCPGLNQLRKGDNAFEYPTFVFLVSN